MTYKYISPNELKDLKKERLELMGNAEKALKDEKFDLLIQYFNKIISISEKIGDDQIKDEFSEKLSILKTQITNTEPVEPETKPQNTIFNFINDLIKSSDYIIKETKQQIEVGPPSIKTGPMEMGNPPPKEVAAHFFDNTPESEAIKTQPEKEAPPIIKRKIAPPPISTNKPEVITDLDIKEEINRAGSVEKQLDDLKKILKDIEKKKVATQ